jgi:hypothetical protein
MQTGMEEEVPEDDSASLQRVLLTKFILFPGSHPLPMKENEN